LSWADGLEKHVKHPASQRNCAIDKRGFSGYDDGVMAQTDIGRGERNGGQRVCGQKRPPMITLAPGLIQQTPGIGPLPDNAPEAVSRVGLRFRTLPFGTTKTPNLRNCAT
jgi:hypothetical protein